MAAINIAYNQYIGLTTTNLQSLANSATVGWQSARIDNQTLINALDYEITIKLTTANTAPANDKAIYIYASPAGTIDGGTTWLHCDGGTATLPSGTESAYTITSPNDLVLLGVLNYTTQNMTCQKTFLLSNAFGFFMPDGFSLVIVNFSGAALGTGCTVGYRSVYQTVV